MNGENELERISPIRRLIYLLDSIKKEKPETVIIDGWKNIFGLKPETEIVEVFPHLNTFNDLLYECQNLVEKGADPDNKQQYLQYFRTIKGIVNNSGLSGQMKSLQEKITPLMMQALKFCDTEISKIASEVKINDKEIQELIEKVNELKEKLLNSHISDDTKIFTMELLNSIESALIDYKILGIESLHRTIEKEFLKINFVVSRFKDEETDEKSTLGELFKKIGSLLEKADKTHRYYNTVLAIMTKMPEVIDTLKKLAPPM